MQENQILVPSWIKAGCFIDLKDKQGEWRVAYILNVTKTQIRVRYDGFSSKFDENFSITSANIKPFRSVIRGYTGQIDSTPPRQHYKFTESYHKQSFEKPLNEFIQQMFTKTEYEINQFIRGSHYTWTQYLMTVTYVNKNQFNLAYEYFLKHFELVILYLKEMTKCASFEAWINGRGQEKDEIIEGKKAFAQSYYQIFDSVYAIMQGYPRLKTFFKYNQNYLNMFLSGYNTHTQFMSDYFQNINLIQIYEQSLNKLLEDKTSIINLSFTTGIFRLFAAIEKTIKEKDKKKQLTQKVCQFILRQCQKMPDICVKEEEVWLEKIYSTSKMILLKYSWKLEFFAKFQIINVNSWKCMILSEKLERKVKAINNLKAFFTHVCSPLKKQAMMIASTKNTIQQQIRKLQIFNAIFVQNEHHQIIKKGCELAAELYKQKSVGMDELEIVWKSCRHRLEAVRKVMYAFFEEIAKQMRAEQISLLAQWTFNEELSQEMDKTFFYNFFRRVIDAATPEKLEVIKLLFQFSELRLQDNRDEIRIFSELLTMKKSLKLGFLATTLNKFIQMIPQQKSREMRIFYINLTNDIFYQCKNSDIQMQNKSFNLIYNVLCQQLQTKPKQQDQQQKSKQTVQGCLKLLQNLQPIFDFEPQQFLQLWKKFNEQQNKELHEHIFLPWILQISNAVGLLKIQTYQINRCLKETKFMKDVFNKIFKSKDNFDFITISKFQFQIYRRFLIQVNRNKGVLREEANYLSGITYFRLLDKVEVIQGLKELFQIFLNCRSQNVVARMVAHLIKQLHLNYDTSKSQQAYITRAKKMQQLLLKIQKHIVDGIKKSNTRLVKKCLYLLYDIATTVKQTQKMPQQYSSNISYNHRAAKRKIKITKDEITKQSELSNTMSIKTMKKLICQQYKLLPYNTKLYKAIFEYKKVHEDGTSYDDASASSARSDQVSSGATSQIKNVIFQEIPNQVLYAPISCLMLPDKNAEIVVKEVHNVVYELIERFVNDKVSEQLLKILAGPQTFEKEASQLAYKILIEVSCSNSSALQIVNNLINQLKAKKKVTQQSLGFGDQSVNFRMYFCKNIIKLQAQQLKQFLSPKNISIIKPIFEQLPRQITEPLQIDLLLQILTITKKALTLLKPQQNMLSRQSIIKCMVNQLEYHVLLQQTQQFKKQDRTHVHLNQLTVLHQCLNILEILHDKKSQKFLDFVVKNQQFPKIMNLMFKTIHRSQFGDQFHKRLEDHMKRANKLDVTSEKIMFQVIFDSLYSEVIQNRKRKNMSFFKLIRCFVTVASSTAIQHLLGKHSQTSPSFWQTCLKTIQKQSDTSMCNNQKQKQNKTLSGHLLILQALLRKNPKSINLVLCRTILYNCLLYNKQETIDKVKCTSRGSIYAALEVLLVMVQSQQLYMRFIVSELRKYQQTQYWRIVDFWNVTLDNQLKSPVGYVGLENPGCICYLNSFTQSLFMNQEFRSSVQNFVQVDPTKDYSLLHELRKLFYNLEYSNQKFLNPVPFTKAIKNAEDKPMIKIFEQMDIQEYSSILFDKIEKLLPKDQDFVKQIFGGTYSNDIISKECKHCSTREESFLSMQVDVKANLQQSLRTLVKGQLLEGENAYYCQKCNKKVRALKRMSIKKLPNNLIICLKRFEYNFETDQKFKVNSCCEFPRQLNLQQFSQQFLSSEQELQQINKLQEEKEQEKEKEKENEQFKLHKLPHQYFEYKLKGVIIHTGSSESGHYYALLESNTQPDKWLEFNDSSVTEFDIQNLADQAFGSDEPAYPKFKNAYMLIYQRKIKISPNPNPHPNSQQPSQQLPQQIPQIPQIPTPQQNKILNQIQHRNTQIQTFHTLFTPQYQQFVTSIFLYSLRTNAEVYHQYKQLVKKEGILQMPQSQNLLPHKLFNTDCIQEVVKFLLEYTLFIRARDANIKVLGDFMREVQKQLDTSVFMGVADYFLHQLSQPVLVQELFVEVSFRDKLTIISHFVCEVVLNRLKRRNNNINDSSTVLVIRMAETFTSVMVKNNACINQLMYILRRIVQQHKQFIEYFEQMGIFRNIFELLAGIDTNNESRNNKIIGIRCEANEILLQKLRHYKLEDSSSIQLRVKNEEMEEQDDYIEAKYEIEGVRQTSKCVLKQESPQQAWNYFYFIYQYQNQIIRQYGLDSQSSVSEQQKENSVNKSQNKFIFRRDMFLTQFDKLKDFRIQQFINECQGSKAAASLALLLCEVAHENQKTTFRLLSVIKKGLNELQAVKFRSYLILLYYLVYHQDSLLNTKIQTTFNVLLSALKANEKYFSETDIIQQWIVMTSKPFAQMLVRTQEGIQLLNEIIDRIEVQKKPTAQLIKKQRNPTYERLNYQIHGLIVSIEYEDYDKLYLIKKSFFTKLFHEQAFPLQIQAHLKILSVLQPNYEQLNTPVRIGTSMVYMFNRRWSRIFIKLNRFGLIKVSKMIKEAEKKVNEEGSSWKKKQGQHRTNVVEIQGKLIQMEKDYRLCSQQHLIWQTEERLRFINVIQKEEGNKNTVISKQNKNSESPAEKKPHKQDHYEQNSSISYQSSGSNV